MVRKILRLIHVYVYGRWTTMYARILRKHVIPRLSPQGRSKLADGYHGKVLTHDHAKAIVTLNRSISKRDLEQIIPYAQARTLVLKAPPDIVVYECACRLSHAEHCQPTQVCMMIGKPVTDFILKHHPHKSRRINQSEALELLRTSHARGNFHSAWFKDVIGGRFYAICNCCKCCCTGVEAMLNYGAPMIASSGYAARVDETLCTACEICADVCPFTAIQINGNALINWDACVGCGACEGQCPSKAIALERDEGKGVPLDVRELPQGL